MSDLIVEQTVQVVRVSKTEVRVTVASGAGGSGLPATTGDQYAVLMEDPGGTPKFQLLKSFMIAPDFSVSMSGGGTVEVGATVTTPAFTASYVDGPPDTATLTDTEGHTKDVTSTPTSFASSNNFTKTANNATVTFTLTADKGDEEDTSQATYAWRPRVFYGVASAGVDTEAEVEALPSSALASSRAATLSVSPGAGQYIYYAYPASYGAATFTVGGFEGGFDLVNATLSITNSNGVTQDYRLYKSTNANLGSTTVVVS